MAVTTATDWHQTACILCECNCGIEVRLGAGGRSFERIRGDKAHPVSQGYTCEKALRLDHYQNERRSFTANTIVRAPTWRKRDAAGALRIASTDSDALGLGDGDAAVLTTKRGCARVTVEITPMMRAGHVSLPNGLGVTETPGDVVVGVAPNELTSSEHRDPIAGTPYHKHVPARLEPLPAP
jgi:anaerobic selenocysteine-containing dehydrogenase